MNDLTDDQILILRDLLLYGNAGSGNADESLRVVKKICSKAKGIEQQRRKANG